MKFCFQNVFQNRDFLKISTELEIFGKFSQKFRFFRKFRPKSIFFPNLRLKSRFSTILTKIKIFENLTKIL